MTSQSIIIADEGTPQLRILQSHYRDFAIDPVVPSKGNLPRTIDPATVTLSGVPVLRWAYEDVATPYEPYLGKEDAFDCNELGADGFLALTLKFDSPALAAAVGDVADGDVLVLPLAGNLLEEFGGTPIVGEDVVVILKKGKE